MCVELYRSRNTWSALLPWHWKVRISVFYTHFVYLHRSVCGHNGDKTLSQNGDNMSYLKTVNVSVNIIRTPVILLTCYTGSYDSSRLHSPLHSSSYPTHVSYLSTTSNSPPVIGEGCFGSSSLVVTSLNACILYTV